MELESDFAQNQGEVARLAGSVPPNLTPHMRIAGKYELCRRIGGGSMGEVWAAKHLSLGEEVAIKIVMRESAHEDGSSADQRFLLEARVAAQLSRKTRHIVSVTDHGECGPYAYLAMELLSGEALDVRLARTGPMPLSKVIPLVYQVARALAVAHADHIVHRDLKPSNVFVTVDEDGRALIKILDFGIAKMTNSMRRLPISMAKHATLRGFLLGTPAYMSPEQARGMQIDHRADVWALAVIAYHLLTGQYPFDGDTIEELFDRLCGVKPTPITAHRPDLPVAVSDLFARAFARQLDQRFASAVSFAGALEQIETEARRDGAFPAPMDAISLPPPVEEPAPPRPLLAAVEERSKSQEESSIIAAGVPRRRQVKKSIVLGAVMIGLGAAMSTVLSVYFEHDPITRPGLAAVGALPPVNMHDESIPPPDPNLASAPHVQVSGDRREPNTLSSSSSASNNALRVVMPQAVTTTASLPPDAPPIATLPAPATPTSPPSKTANRSEVF